MKSLVSVCKHDIIDRKRVQFHAVGKYVPDHPNVDYLDAVWGRFKPAKPWEDEYSYNNGRTYSKCGILIAENPYGIGAKNMRQPIHIFIRRDHAEKFAEPCKKCFKKETRT